MEVEPHPAGRGVYGAVSRAVPVGDAHAPEAALKIALLPEDPRFAQEAELLGRMRHPSIPRLLDQGQWQSPGGPRHTGFYPGAITLTPPRKPPPTSDQP